MGDIKTFGKRLRKTARGIEHVGDTKFTILGKKRPFFGSRYMVFADTQDAQRKTVWHGKGNFTDVLFDMKENERARAGVTLLREVAKAISDSKSTLRSSFTDKELLCLKALKDGPMELGKIVDDIQDDANWTYIILGKLQKRGLVYTYREEEELPRLYALTVKGSQIVDGLAEEEAFARMQKDS